MLATLTPLLAEDFLLNFRIYDGLYGSGVVQITITRILIVLQSLLFFFASNRLELHLQLEKNSGKIFLQTAAKENENDIREFMTDIINQDADE